MNEIVRILLGLLAGVAAVAFCDYFARRSRSRSYIRMATKSKKNENLDVELQKLLDEEKDSYSKAGAPKKEYRIDLDVIAAVNKKKLRKANKKDFYQARPSNSASWGSD